jgi:hypothetical protein
MRLMLVIAFAACTRHEPAATQLLGSSAPAVKLAGPAAPPPPPPAPVSGTELRSVTWPPDGAT